MKVKGFFRHAEAERIHQEQACIIRNVKKNPLARIKMIPDGNKDLHKGMKIIGIIMILVSIKFIFLLNFFKTISL